MSAESTRKENPTRDLAQTIYKDLVVGAAKVSDEGVKMSGNPENMAKLAMKLAEVVHQGGRRNPRGRQAVEGHPAGREERRRLDEVVRTAHAP
jgi:hypothetical protein